MNDNLITRLLEEAQDNPDSLYWQAADKLAVSDYEYRSLLDCLKEANSRIETYETLINEMDRATRMTYLSGLTVVQQFIRVRDDLWEVEEK